MFAACPPVVGCGRLLTPDGLSSAITVGSLYLLFARRSLLGGVLLLLVSLYVRTDNLLLLLAVVYYLASLSRTLRMRRCDALVTAGLGVCSVAFLNYVSGHYSWAVLLHHTLISLIPNAAEMVINPSLHDYAVAVRHCLEGRRRGGIDPFSDMRLGLLEGSTERVAGSASFGPRDFWHQARPIPTCTGSIFRFRIRDCCCGGRWGLLKPFNSPFARRVQANPST